MLVSHCYVCSTVNISKRFPVDKVEEKETGKSDLKILGKIDLDKIASKSRKPKKKPKEKVKEVPVTKKTEKKVVEVKTDIAEKVVVPVKEEVKTDTTVKIKEEVKPEVKPKEDSNFIKTRVEKLSGPTILGSIKLPEVKKPEKKKPVASSSDDLAKAKKKKRRRIKKPGETTVQPNARKKERPGGRRFKDKTPTKEHSKPDVTDEQIQKECSGPRSPHPSLRGGHSALVQSLCLAAGKRPGMERRGGGGGLSLPSPHLAAGSSKQ